MKKVVITGVNRGLGREMFRQFIAKDYFVYGVLRNQSEYEALQKNLPDNCELILADIGSDSSINLLQEAIQDHPIDLLINNAGIGGSESTIEKTETSEINEAFNIHCLGVVRTVKALRNNLLKSSDPLVISLNSRFGSITRQDKRIYEDLAVSYSYRIAKASQNMLTVSLRSEFKDKIRFVSLHPGKMKTEIASKDADVEPLDVANRILEQCERGELKEENGITELDKELIEW